jgi:hypothetical protein
MQLAQILVTTMAVYGGLGAIFAVAFTYVGIEHLDPVARHAPLGFRLIVAPGSVLLWPLLLVRWIQAVRR